MHFFAWSVDPAILLSQCTVICTIFHKLNDWLIWRLPPVLCRAWLQCISWHMLLVITCGGFLCLLFTSHRADCLKLLCTVSCILHNADLFFCHIICMINDLHFRVSVWSLVLSHLLQNSSEISKFCGKGQILRLGLKFRDPRKTVGPNLMWRASNV